MADLQSSDIPALDTETARALRAFMRRLEGRYAVREGILFGSRARLSHGPDSDADLAVVLECISGNRRAAAQDMAGIAFDVMLETGILVDALPVWEHELDGPDSSGNPALIRSIRRDGVRFPAAS